MIELPNKVVEKNISFKNARKNFKTFNLFVFGDNFNGCVGVVVGVGVVGFNPKSSEAFLFDAVSDF